MENLKYDTFYRRFFARIIDYFLVILVLTIFTVFIPETQYTIVGFDVAHGIKEIPNPMRDFWIHYSEAVKSLVLIIYFVLFHYFGGQTIGKMIVSVKVLSFNEENKISFYQALLRNLVDIIFLILILFVSNEYITGGLGVSWLVVNLIQIFSNKKYRTIEDLIANTVVVRIFSEKAIVEEANQSE